MCCHDVISLFFLTDLDKEVFTDVTEGERYEADLLVQARFQAQSSYFLIHVENQSYSQASFNQRMFRYFARLHEKYNLPIYPIVVLSYERPKRTASSSYQLDFPDFKVLEFNYQVVQLNQLNWRDFLNRHNPIASALMAKMQIAPADRPKVKAECLRLLVTLKLDPARMQLISGFIDTYLNLNELEERVFREQIGTIELEKREEVMQIVTSWMRTGIQQGQASMVMRLLKHKFGEIDSDVEAQIQQLDSPQLEDLSEALLDFERKEELTTWLSHLPSSN